MAKEKEFKNCSKILCEWAIKKMFYLFLFEFDCRRLKNLLCYTPYDDFVVGSFFSNLKREELYRSKYRSDKEFKKGVDDYMSFYNTQQPHSNNNYRTPNAKEAECFSKNNT